MRSFPSARTTAPAHLLHVLACLLLGAHAVPGLAAAYTERTGQQAYEAACTNCHSEGKYNAPRIGDRAAWTPRMAKGLEALVQSAVHGHNGMPARGGLAELERDELRNAIVYMFNYGLPPPPTPERVAPADPHHKTIAGTDIYFGLISADALRSSRQGVPSGKGYYHLNVSLSDVASKAALKDAKVSMRVSDGMTVQSKPLDPVVANNSVSYGNYFHFDSGSAYNIVAEIQRPGSARPIEAAFEFRAP